MGKRSRRFICARCDEGFKTEAAFTEHFDAEHEPLDLGFFSLPWDVQCEIEQHASAVSKSRNAPP